MLSVLRRWNEFFFFNTGNARVLLCQEHPKGEEDTPKEGGDSKDDDPLKDEGTPKHYAIYVVDYYRSEDDELEVLSRKLGRIPDDLAMVDIIEDDSSAILEVSEQGNSHATVAPGSVQDNGGREITLAHGEITHEEDVREGSQ